MFSGLKRIFSKNNQVAPSRYQTKEHTVKRPFNCAKVYVGKYVGGGTNEFEEEISCSYDVIEGSVITKKLKPIKVKWTTNEYQTSILQTLVIYPKTDTATITIMNSHGANRLKLVKVRKDERSTIFKAGL